MTDMVNHPPHYLSASNVECINISRLLPLSLGTAVKYVWRFRDKGKPAEDLDKALWYLEDYAKHLFKDKNTDALLHTTTTEGALTLFNGPARSDLRKHIVFLQENGYPEHKFFEILYQFLNHAQRGIVSYDTFVHLGLSVKKIREAMNEEPALELVDSLSHE